MMGLFKFEGDTAILLGITLIPFFFMTLPNKKQTHNPGKKKSRNFGLFAGNPAVFSAGFPLVLYFKAGNPANH